MNDINILLERSDTRLSKAVACLSTPKSKRIFISLALLFPEAGIFYAPDEEEAWIEGDDFQIRVSS